MNIYELKKMSASERAAIFEGEEFTEEVYMQPVDDNVVDEHKTNLAQASLKQRAILEEKKEAMDGFKERLKPLVEEIGQCLDVIKARAIEVTGKIYKIADFDNQMIHNVDPQGNVLGSRRMKPEERQLSITSLKASAQ